MFLLHSGHFLFGFLELGGRLVQFFQNFLQLLFLLPEVIDGVHHLAHFFVVGALESLELFLQIDDLVEKVIKFFPDKLEGFPLETLSIGSYNLKARPEETQLEENLSDASFFSKLLVLLTNVRLDWKVIARYKHSTLLGLIISDEEKRFFNIDTWSPTHRTNKFLLIIGKAAMVSIILVNKAKQRDGQFESLSH
jgi:hypothetical protein